MDIYHYINMSKLLLVALTLLLLASCKPSPVAVTSTPSLAAVTSQSDVETEEYAVYSTLIEAWYVDEEIQLIVVRDHTEGPFRGEILEELAEINDEMIADFKTRNRQLYSIKPLFDLEVEYVIMTAQERREIFSSPDLWDKFYKRYPNSQGLMTLSRVGFNPQMNKAVLYIANTTGSISWGGYYVLLVKENNAWRVRDQATIAMAR